MHRFYIEPSKAPLSPSASDSLSPGERDGVRGTQTSLVLSMNPAPSAPSPVGRERVGVRASASQPNLIELSERETHHATRVLRLRGGESVVCLDGQGGEYHCEVQTIRKNSVQLLVLSAKKVPPLPYQLTLVQALPKGKTMETIIQKAAELGAFRVAPIMAERSVVQLEEESSEAKREKWNCIAIDAIKQCGSTWLPKIEKPQKLPAFLATNHSFELSLLASLHEEVQHPRARFDHFRAAKNRNPATVVVYVGPEGDFSPSELAALRNSGALPITLGPLVLRSDTAAIYCLSVLNHELQEFSKRQS